MRKLYFSFYAVLCIILTHSAAAQKTTRTAEERSCVRTPITADQLHLRNNPVLIEQERERVKNLSPRTSTKTPGTTTVATRQGIFIESVFPTGNLSVSDPTFNRPLSMNQGGSCGLSGVGTATHYKTHSFTLTSASNVTVSVVASDGGAVTAGADTFLGLYGPGGFVPASGCTNLIAANDDASGFGALSRIVTTTPLAPGTYTALITSFDNVPSNFPWNYTLAILFDAPVTCTPGNLVTDGSYEATSPVTLMNPNWTLTSTNFGSPLCDDGNCGNGGGTATPRTGTFWAWFGGTTAAENASAQQTITIPSSATSATLNYYLRIGSVTAPFNATLRILVDGVVQSTITEPAVAEAAYTLRTLNLSAFADGNPHTIRFDYTNPAGSGTSNFSVDDVTLDIACGACVAPTITTQPAGSRVCATGNGTFTVAAAGTGLTYQWQENTGSGFNNITNGGVYSGATSATLTITGATAAMNSYQYRAVITGTCGNVTSNPAMLLVNQTTHSSAIATPAVVCAPGSTVITATAGGTASSGNIVLASSGTINLPIADNTPAGTSSVIALTGATLPTAADLKLRLNIRHSWVGDLRVSLTSPCGTTLLFDRPGVPATTFGNGDNLGTSNASTPPPAVYIFDIAGATVLNETSVAAGFIPAGTYKPSDASNPGFAHNWAGMTFPCGAGNWTLTLVDNVSGDVGMLVDWAILRGNTYTHTLVGPGTIVQNPPTGPSNANASFNVTNIPAGNQTYTLTTTDAAGCTAVSTIPVVVNANPVITFVPPAPSVCLGSVQQLAATVTPGLPQVVTGGGAITLNASGIATPYPSNLAVTGLPASGVTVQSVRINGFTHTFPSDLDILLQSPTGTNIILLSDHGGGTDVNNISLTFDGSAATTVPNPIVAGTFRPTNIAGPDNFPAPGPGSITQVNPTFASLGTGNYNGIWKLFILDQFAGDGGSITDWEITFSLPVPITWSSATGAIFTDPAATVAYTGAPTLNPVYVKPTVSTVYTASVSRLGCTSSANVTVNINQLPAITTQPSPATQNSCPGFTVNYSVAATGAGLTYQWRKNGVNLVNGVQASGSTVSGATTANLVLSNLFVADGGTYTVVVSGTCAPAVTSSGAVLVVASPPTITTQPANRTVCVGQPAAFSVVVGGTPAPVIFQWQVSSDNGVTWSNITTGGFTSTYTLPSATLANNGNRYRVIVTNSCGQTITSNGTAALTVNAVTPATVTALPARICLSDGMIPLTGSPTGGTWSGIGVSGSNFVPSATAVGTYTLTYSYVNAGGCAGTSTVIARVVDDGECSRIRLLSDDALVLYPNPNNGVFNVRVNSTLYNYLGMHVSTPAGQLVHTQTFTNLVYGQIIPVDLTRLPSGTYMVRMFYDDGQRTSQKTFTVVIGRP